jgi:hypothetical protein
MPRMSDYPTKATPAPDDQILLVDVHDASQSPQGTTKKATVASIGGGGAVASVSAGDASAVVSPTTGAVTVEAGPLHQIAALHPPTAAVPLNGQKVTGLASGSASTDAAAYGQTPAGGNTVTVPQGGTGQTTQQAALNALTGTQSAGKYVRSDGTNAALQPIQASDVPTLNQSTTGTAAGLSSTLAVGSGGTGQTTQQAALDALAGAVTSGDFLRGSGTHVQMSAIQAADVPQLADYAPTGLTGATAPTRYGGGTISGHPLTGTWSTGDWVVDQQGHIFACILGGTPGTWRRVGKDGYQFFLDDYCKGDGRQALVTTAAGSATITTTPLAAPAAPTVNNSGSGGTILAGVYQVKVTYVNRWGETVASSSTSTTTSGSTSTITITAPTSSGNATGWYAYVTQLGGSTYTRQQAPGSPTAIGAALVLTAPPTSSGANPPGADSSASQAFASGDVGKNIMICGGLGSPGAPWIDTIATFVSATSVTLSTNGASQGGNVNQAGCAAVWASDDRANVDQCISDASAYALLNNHFFQVIGSDKNYGLGTGLFQSVYGSATWTYNTQVRLPVANTSGQTPKLEGQLLGPGDNAHNEFWVSQLPNLNGCTFVSFSAGPNTADPTYGQQSVIGGPIGGSGAGTNGFFNAVAVIKGVRVVQPGWSNSIGIDVLQMGGCVIRGASMVYAPSTNTGGGINPSFAWITNSFWQNNKIATGIRLPNVANNDDVIVESFACQGMNRGLDTHADHVSIGRLVTINCDASVVLHANTQTHALNIGQWSFENVNGGLLVQGNSNTKIQVDITMDGENASIGYDISDAGNALTGTIRWNDIFRSPQTPTVVGAANVQILNNGLARGAMASPPSPPGSGSPSVAIYRDTEVTLSLSAGTLTALSIDSVDQHIPASCVLWKFQMPSGHTYTPTYTGTLSNDVTVM